MRISHLAYTLGLTLALGGLMAWMAPAAFAERARRDPSWRARVLMRPAAPASRAEELRVRGQSKLYADLQAAGDSLQISGVLRDELGQPLPRREIALSVARVDGAWRAPVTSLWTDMQGRFQDQQPLEPGTYYVSLLFAEDEHLDGDTLARQLEIKPAPYRLELQGPPTVVGLTRPATVRLRASAGGVGVRASVEVFVNEQRVAQAPLDHYGRGSVDVREALTPGLNVVRASLSSADAARVPAALQPAPVTLTVRYAPEAILSATLALGHDRFERGLRVLGHARDGLGPLPHGQVIVEFERVAQAPQDTRAMLDAVRDAQDSPPETPTPVLHAAADAGLMTRYRAQSQVDPQGQFVAFAPQKALQEGVWRARVVYSPEVGPSTTLVTEPITLDRSASRWALHALGLLTILVGLGLLGQRQYLGRLSALWRARQRARQRDDLDLSREEVLVLEAYTPTQDDAPASTALDGIAGVVWDTWREQPIPEATLELRATQTQEVVRVAQSDQTGRFHLEGLPAGTFELSITARGFVRGRLQVTLPHQGQLSSVRASLVAVPLKIRRAYQVWVKRWHGQDAWGVQTPRQLEVALWDAMRLATATFEDPAERERWHMRLQTFLIEEHTLDAMALERLIVLMTELVEESYYSQRVYEESLWRLLVELTRRLEAVLEPPSLEVPR